MNGGLQAEREIQQAQRVKSPQAFCYMYYFTILKFALVVSPAQLVNSLSTSSTCELSQLFLSV